MIRVVLIEDNVGDAALMEEYLNGIKPERYHVSHFTRIDDAVSHLESDNAADIIISDIGLPDSQGEQSFHKLQEIANDLPVIFSTSTYNDDMATKAIERGAQDYLIKGHYDSETLIRAIRYAMERKKFQREFQLIQTNEAKYKAAASQYEAESKELLKLNRAKDDFLSIASHQLRTPATGVKQYLGMVIEGFMGEITEQQRNTLEEAYRSNERQLKIIGDILQTAHLDAGRVDITAEPTDAVELIERIISELENHFTARHQTVKLEHTKPSIVAHLDSYHLRMALENIIENASKYTPDYKKITVTAKDTKGALKIDITDQGVGIAEDDFDKVFDKFARVSNPLSTEVGGSGLGLYWSKRIIDLHGGSITLSSKVGEGTTFSICLPKEAHVG